MPFIQILSIIFNHTQTHIIIPNTDPCSNHVSQTLYITYFMGNDFFCKGNSIMLCKWDGEHTYYAVNLQTGICLGESKCYQHALNQASGLCEWCYYVCSNYASISRRSTALIMQPSTFTLSGIFIPEYKSPNNGM